MLQYFSIWAAKQTKFFRCSHIFCWSTKKFLLKSNKNGTNSSSMLNPAGFRIVSRKSTFCGSAPWNSATGTVPLQQNVIVAWFKRAYNLSIWAPKQTKLFRCSHLLQIEAPKNFCWSRTKTVPIRAACSMVNLVDFRFVPRKSTFCGSARGAKTSPKKWKSRAL